MNKNNLFALIVLFIVSCTSDKDAAEKQNPNEQTPEVLNDERKIDISSYSKRYGTDIIQELFDEALKNDKDLKTASLNDKHAIQNGKNATQNHKNA